ncbi:ribonuclease P protein component [Ramlibacter sp. AN1015]|uniref:ribonuclease P protein component n=1 Tax=Ramlibacter sp. AN1015 TaxID=3133428 RepID=UPI0030BFB98C
MERLKTRAQFEAVLAGQTVSRTAHFALHRAAPKLLQPGPHAGSAAHEPASAGPKQALFPGHTAWIGVVVPKRWAKRAVTRNTIKRQIHALAQEMSAELPLAAHVVRLRAGFERSRFTSATSDALRNAVRQELLTLFSGARRCTG